MTTNRETHLLDAAIQVLGTDGLRSLTHRAVDAVAELPEGSTSNRFRSREALLTGVLDRILQRETAVWAQTTDASTPTTIEEFAVAMGHVLTRLTGHDRVLSQARRVVFVEAANQPALADTIVRARQQLASWLGPLLAGYGSSDPAGHVRALLALLDGLLGSQLSDPEPDFDPATPIAALLNGLAAEPAPTMA